MTSIPASRSARAMIFAPRSCPSRPGLATTTRIFRATRGSLDGRCLGSACRSLPRDEVAVPVEALLRHPLERREVDIDHAEAFPVAPRPLEIVEQRPDEISLHGRSRLDGATDRGDVTLEIVPPLR